MLFNSYVFIFVYLPAVAIIYIAAWRHFGYIGSVRFLVFASLVFYGYWNPLYLLLISGSICANYLVGNRIVAAEESARKRWFVLGIGVNLGLIGLFKYADFLIGTVNHLTSGELPYLELVLPLAISFFTFQQIAFLADVRHMDALPCNFSEYCLFVTFFPQLIAGPIVHHAEVTPQYRLKLGRKPQPELIAMGLTVFILGLAKKVLVADGMAGYATPVFDAAASGYSPTWLEAWVGVFGYSFQIYYDFSGYSDMAIGLGLLFGIRLPINFNSPYKATSIIDFWRRWHITLSRFLRDYLYVPLGGNRRGTLRRFSNLAITMLLGGLWHGASWTFVVWGGLHGFFLLVNHGWRTLWRGVSIDAKRHSGLLRVFHSVGWALTFLAVMVAWVFFRAVDFETALRIIRGLAGFNGVVLPISYEVYVVSLPELVKGWLPIESVEYGFMAHFRGKEQFVWLIGLLAATLVLPNSLEFIGYVRSKSAKILSWSVRPQWALAMAGVFFICILSMTRVSEFLYFQF